MASAPTTMGDTAAATAAMVNPYEGIHPPMLPSRPPPKKRNRAALSCTSCRERKIKCDRNVPCQQCVKRGDEAYCRMAPHPKDKAKEPSQPQQQPSSIAAPPLASSSAVMQPSASAASAIPTSSWLSSISSATLGTSNPYAFPVAAPAASDAVQAPSNGNAAAAELTAIKQRLAQLEASLVQAQMSTAQPAALAPGADAAGAANIMPHSANRDQSTAGKRASTSGQGVDSDTEDAAAVLEGLAMGRKKDETVARYKAVAAMAAAAVAASSSDTSSTHTAGTGPSPAGTADSPATTSTDPTSLSVVSNPAAYGHRNSAFQTLLDADKRRSIMLPLDSADEHGAPRHNSGAVLGDSRVRTEPMEIDEGRERPNDGDTDMASEAGRIDEMSPAFRLFQEQGKVLSEAYQDAASVARSQVDAQRRAAAAHRQHSASTASAASPSTAISPASGSHLSQGASNSADTGDVAAAATSATHIRGPTAESYDLARSHQGLFRVIVQGESMLGFGLGWPFAAAEENGDYKVVKGIGECPGNTQREAVLRAIVRTIPERDTVDHMLNVWEENVSFLAGKVIHVPTLRKEIETFFAFDSVEKRARVVSYVDPGWLAVLLMVFVTAMQFWPCNSAKSPTIFDGRSQSMWYAAAKSALVLARYQSSQSLSVLQSIILINLHAQEPGRVNTALMRIAINNAMDLRLHRLGDADKALTAGGATPGPCQFVRRQIELRIWWALVYRDWTSSACTSSYIINPDYMNTPLPANLNEFELCRTPTPQPHPINVATEMSYVLANIEFAKAVRYNTDLLSKASIASAGKSKSLPLEDVQRLDEVYREVLSGAPRFFQAGSQEGEGTNIEIQRWLFVQSVFHKLLHLHRPRISSTAESRVTCVLLARSILDMQSKLRRRSGLISSLCLNLLQSFSAASLLCLDLMQSPPRGSAGADPALREAIRAEVGEALEALRSVSEENHTAQRMFRIIEALLAEEEHRWVTGPASATTSTTSQEGASTQPLVAFHPGLKRKRTDQSTNMSSQQMTSQERKKELIRLAKRVAEAAQEHLPPADGSCPLAEHARQRAQETRDAEAQGQTQAGPATGNHPGSGPQLPLEQLQGQGRQLQFTSHAHQASMASGPGQGQAQSTGSSATPLIIPTPSLAEHPLFTNREIAANTLPTQPTFASQQYALSVNGIDFSAPLGPTSTTTSTQVLPFNPAQAASSGALPAVTDDPFAFDLNSFMALMNASQSPSSASGNGAPNGEAMTMSTAETMPWLGGTNATPDALNGSSANLSPSPAASGATRSKDVAKADKRLAGLQAGLPTPPTSDAASTSTGSSSGQSPTSTATSQASADAGTDWFWNWVLGQGATVGHSRNAPPSRQALPALQQVAQTRAAATAAAQEERLRVAPSTNEYQSRGQGSNATNSLLSSFLPAAPVAAASPNTQADSQLHKTTVRHPNTPSSYFSSHFFAPSNQHLAHAEQTEGNALGVGTLANLGTPSANLDGTNTNGSAVKDAAPGTTEVPPSSLPDMSLQDLGTWLNAPSLFDFAGDMGIAEGDQNISVDAGYLGAAMLA